ncbi:MAG TPA: hypothetical protein VMV89_10865 [Candidatus Paceibacterota bacterium]|nr:hypothetical protein [Candidatus Paceibacterota bacterium]
MKRPHIPVPIITHNGGLVIAAAQAHPEIATRLTAAAITAADTLCTKVSGDVTGQKGAKGELGSLTAGQKKNLNTLHQCMAAAAKTAKLAFPRQTVKLHQEFQIGQQAKNDLASYLGRVDIVLGSIANAANNAAFKTKGWTDDETTAFQTARDAFGPAEQYRVKSISGAKDTTAQKNADAELLYETILTIQNAADLEWPAADPANAGVRGEFLLGIFPPDHGGNHTPPPAPIPAASKP